MVLGALLLHEQLSLNSYIGSALIIGGILVNVLPLKSRQAAR